MKGLILNILERSDYINRATLLKELRSLGMNVGDRKMRKEIEAMIEDGFYIQSSEKGYKLCRTPQDFAQAKAYLRKKAVALLKRCGYFDKGLREKGQLKLTL